MGVATSRRQRRAHKRGTQRMQRQEQTEPQLQGAGAAGRGEVRRAGWGLLPAAGDSRRLAQPLETTQQLEVVQLSMT